MRTQRITVACALSALLAACAGAEGAGTTAPGPANPSAPEVASGTVTGLGSTLSVDGVEYAVSGATVSDDTDPANPLPASLGDLLLGQQVDVSMDTSCHLTHIAIGATVVGLVDPGSIDTVASRFTVLGQPVAFTPAGRGATLFVGVLDASALEAGRLVKVHGPVDPQGTIRARLVVVLPAGAPLVQRVRGVISGADAAAHTFKLGSLTVAAAAARVLPSGAALEDGKPVIVFSRQAATGTAPALTLPAEIVRVPHERAKDVVVRLGGPITSVAPVEGQAVPNFTLDGVRIDASKATLASGTTAAALVVGALVRVEGPLAGGVLKAREIAVVADEAQRRVVLTGQVSSFDGPASFVVRGTTVDASAARFTEGSSAAQLADGVCVTVLGHVSGSHVVADQITVFRPPQEVPMTLIGVVDHLDPASAPTTTFELLGMDMRLDPSVSWTGGTASDLADGVRVEVTGSRVRAVFVVTAVRFLSREPGHPMQVHLAGVITALKPAAAPTQFVLNNTTVTVEPSTEIVNGPLAEGQRVLVLARKAAPGGAAVALRIEVFPANHPEPCPFLSGAGCSAPVARPVYVTGPISEVEGTTFKVDAQVVDASGAQLSPEGATAADLAVGRVVTVGGTLSEGVLTAKTVRFLHE